MSGRNAKLILGVMLVCGLLTAVAPAQEQILTKIPADALGFVVINNVTQFTTQLDQWLQDTGLAPILQAQMPQGALQALRDMTMLGEGFNPDLPFAVVMLDPKAYGVRLPGEEPPAEETAAPAERKLPFVLLVPGSSTQAVFGSYAITPEGAYSKVALRMGEMFAKDQDGYVMLSPLAAALDAMSNVSQPAWVALADKHRQLIAESGIALHLNMDVAQPIIEQLMAFAKQKMQQQMQDEMGSEVAVMGMWNNTMSFYQTLFKQAQSATAGGQFVPTGLVMRKLVDFRPDSNLQRMFAACRNGAASLLDRVPDNQYFLAMGARELPDVPEFTQFQRQMMTDMMDSPMMADVPAEKKAQWIETAVQLDQQILKSQFVAGGTGGAGVVGLAIAMEVRDAQKTRQLIADFLPVYEEMLNKATKADPASRLTIQMAPATQSAAGQNVDVIRFSNAEIEQDVVSDPQFQQMLGQSALEAYLASPSQNLVVITFGGGMDFLASAMATAAAASGQIASVADSQQAMQYMPDNRFMVGLFNLSGLFGMLQRIGEQQGLPLPFQAEGTTPLALGIGADPDGAMRASMFLPNTMVKDITGVVMQFMMMSGGGMPMEQPENASPQEDF